ncbi:Uma2 family endonuclease [Spirosoma arcticum]
MTLSNQQIRTADEFYYFCQENPNHRFECEPDDHIIEIPLSGGTIGRLDAQITADLSIWNETAESGLVFSSSTAFHLPDGSLCVTNATWVSRERWEALSEREQEKFPPICPNFVIELLSPSDSLNATKTKMTDVWMANGCRLAWLIDPKTEMTHIFRANGEIQIVQGFDKPLSGEDVLVGFDLQV